MNGLSHGRWRRQSVPGVAGPLRDYLDWCYCPRNKVFNSHPLISCSIIRINSFTQPCFYLVPDNTCKAFRAGDNYSHQLWAGAFPQSVTVAEANSGVASSMALPRCKQDAGWKKDTTGWTAKTLFYNHHICMFSLRNPWNLYSYVQSFSHSVFSHAFDLLKITKNAYIHKFEFSRQCSIQARLTVSLFSLDEMTTVGNIYIYIRTKSSKAVMMKKWIEDISLSL